MVIPSVEETMISIFGGPNNPYYTKGYQDGYEQAKLEMFEKLKIMQALYDCTTTWRPNER